MNNACRDAPKLAKWKDGIVDEPWKRRVVLADRQRAINTINGLGTILFGSTFPGVGPVDYEGQCAVLGKLTGEQIAGAMLDYWRRIGRQLEASKDLPVEPIGPAPLGPVGSNEHTRCCGRRLSLESLINDETQTPDRSDVESA